MWWWSNPWKYTMEQLINKWAHFENMTGSVHEEVCLLPLSWPHNKNQNEINISWKWYDDTLFISLCVSKDSYFNTMNFLDLQVPRVFVPLSNTHIVQFQHTQYIHALWFHKCVYCFSFFIYGCSMIIARVVKLAKSRRIQEFLLCVPSLSHVNFYMKISPNSRGWLRNNSGNIMLSSVINHEECTQLLLQLVCGALKQLPKTYLSCLRLRYIFILHSPW